MGDTLDTYRNSAINFGNGSLQFKVTCNDLNMNRKMTIGVPNSAIAYIFLFSNLSVFCVVVGMVVGMVQMVLDVNGIATVIDQRQIKSSRKFTVNNEVDLNSNNDNA